MIKKILTSDEVVPPSEERQERKDGTAAQALIDAFRNSPHPEIDIAPERGIFMQVRAAPDFDALD